MSDKQGRQFGTLQGGSDADAAKRSNAVGFFQPHVKFIIPTEKKRITGRILPARDLSLSPNDAAYPLSVLPYRDVHSGYLDADTKTPKFNAFWGNIKAYAFFGRTNACITSPQTLKFIPGTSIADQADPIDDCRQYCRKNADETITLNGRIVTLRSLVEKLPNSREKAIIPRVQDKSVFNMYCAEERGQWGNFLVVVAGQAVEDLKKKLSWPTTAQQASPHDPNFPEFLFGDVTSPSNGLVATISPFTVGTVTVNGFNFSTQDNVLVGHRVMAVGEAELRGRYDFLSDKVLRIDTYQDLVNFIVEDGTIPYEIIQKACERMANIPKPPKQNTVVSLPALKPQSTGGGIMGMPIGAPNQALASAPAVEVLCPFPADQKFWMYGPSGVVAATAAQIGAAVKSGGDPNIMPEDKSKPWAKASAFGIKLEVVALPTPPPAPEPPAPPAPEPPAPPAPEPPTTKQSAPKQQNTTLFWVSYKGTVSQKPHHEVQALVDAGETLLVMNKEKTSGWVDPEKLGFVADDIPMAPDAPPAPPTPPAPPAAPDSKASAPPPAPPAAPDSKASAPPFDEAPPTPGLLTPEEQALKASYEERAQNANAPGGPLSIAEINALIELNKKATGLV